MRPRWPDREPGAVGPDAQARALGCFTFFGHLDQLVKDRPADTRIQAPAHVQIGPGLAGHGVGVDADLVVRSRLDLVADVGLETQRLAVAVSGDLVE